MESTAGRIFIAIIIVANCVFSIFLTSIGRHDISIIPIIFAFIHLNYYPRKTDNHNKQSDTDDT